MKLKKPKTLTTIIASAVIAIAPIIGGCQSRKVPVYSIDKTTGQQKLEGYYRSRGFSSGIKVDTYKTDKYKQKKPGYDPNSN